MNKQVQVYRNLHNGMRSIRDSATGHSTRLYILMLWRSLPNCTPFVKKTNREKSKNIC